MSCFIVHSEHINVLVQAATGPLTYGRGPLGLSASGFYRLHSHADSRNAIGQMLLDTNVASVNARYNEAELLAYTYSQPRHYFEPVDILKAIDCYEYQSCEAPDWHTSIAREFCDALRGLCISSLPGYDEAPWGIDERTCSPNA